MLVPTPIPPGHPDHEKGGDPNVPDYCEQSTFRGIFGSFSDAPGGFVEEIREFSASAGLVLSQDEFWN